MLKVNINGVDFKNPVIAASGTFGFGSEYNEFYDVGILGGISSKGLTINPKEGNSGIRVFETPSGMMNSVGLQNPGIDKFINEVTDLSIFIITLNFTWTNTKLFFKASTEVFGI